MHSYLKVQYFCKLLGNRILSVGVFLLIWTAHTSQGRSTHSSRFGHGRTGFLLDIDLHMCKLRKLDVGQVKPRLKQVSGVGKSMIAQYT